MKLRKTTLERIRRHKSLSKKSLDKVREWADANKGNPLTDAYIDACVCVGSINCQGIWRVLGPDWRGGDPFGHITAAYDLSDLAFLYRDEVGRMILDMLRRQTNKAEVLNGPNK